MRSYSRSPSRGRSPDRDDRRYSPARGRRFSPGRRHSPGRRSPPPYRRSPSPGYRDGYRHDRGRDIDPRERDRRRSPPGRRRSPSFDRQAAPRHSEAAGRGRDRSPELDEFGRVIPPPRPPTPEARRESSASRERRRRERRERKREKREGRRASAAADTGAQPSADYRASLYPPGSDTSLYVYDPALYWHITPDRVWWYRPDLTLWYDCRNECYYTYDTHLAEYVSVDKDRATDALAKGLNVAPIYEASAADAEGAHGTAAEIGGEAIATVQPEQSVDGAAHEERHTAAAEFAVETTAGELEGEDEGSDSAPLDLEEQVALAMQSHTESWQGKKDTQEDRYIQGVRLGKLGTLFGVFDGHGGVHAAEYVAKHLPNNIARCHQHRPSSSANRRDGTFETKRLTGAMEEAFPLTDRELMSLARRRAHTDGTTALLVLVRGGDLENLELFCAHVGDCRAVLCRDGHAVRLTQDHRPDRKDEQQRIRAAGGGVFQVAGIWRCTSAAGAARAMDARAGFIDGESHTYLSCSRTIGDPELKMNPERPILSNQPDTSVVKLQLEDLFIVLACDGVWDVLSDQQVTDIVLEHWGDARAAASTIVRTALSSGSGDNLTAQVVLFGWKHELGVATASKRAIERQEEAQRKPAPKPVVEEEDIDMFA